MLAVPPPASVSFAELKMASVTPPAIAAWPAVILRPPWPKGGEVPLTARVPPLTVLAPGYVLAPERVSEPLLSVSDVAAVILPLITAVPAAVVLLLVIGPAAV